MLPALESDRELSRVFFSRLQMLFYAAAGLRQEIVDGFEQVAVEICGERIPWVTGLGATETAPFAMCTGAMWEPEAGRIGVPVPGVELKVEPVGALFEARVRGPNVTPGYWQNPALTRAAFDEDGFYQMGDAIEPVDPADLTRGFVFRGRIAEDFKLATGTWVRVGPLRSALLAHFGDNDLQVPVKIAQEQLGHSSISTTLNIYTHVVDASHRKAIEALERELFPSVPKLPDGPKPANSATRDFRVA